MAEAAREVEGAGTGLTGSPPRSVRVLRLRGFGGGGSMELFDERALLAEADISTSLLGEEGMRLGCRSCEGN